MFLGLLILVIPFIDKVIFRPVHRKRLQLQFENWWKTVEGYDHLKLALRCTQWVSDLLDDFFGAKLLSKKVFIRCAIIANGILIITLSWVGLVDSEPFGITPWKNYSGSIKVAESVMNNMLSNFNVQLYATVDISNAPPFDITTNALIHNKVAYTPVHIITNEFLLKIGTNTCVAKLSRTAEVTISQIQPFTHGSIFMWYNRNFDAGQTTNVSTNFFGKVITSKNPFDQLENDVIKVKSYIHEHGKTKYIVAYSLAYFLLLFSVNTVLFIGSLVLCRITLREIVISGRLISALALVFTNIVLLFSFAIGLLLFMTLLAVPLLWLFFPTAYFAAKESIYTFVVFLSGAALVVWIMSGISAKLVALIALLPNLFAAIVGGFSVLAIKWKKLFYVTVSGILIRCVDNNPLTVILVTVVFISGLIAFIAKMLHLTSFL